jgi:hypothetical protein
MVVVILYTRPVNFSVRGADVSDKARRKQEIKREPLPPKKKGLGLVKSRTKENEA